MGDHEAPAIHISDPELPKLQEPVPECDTRCWSSGNPPQAPILSRSSVAGSVIAEDLYGIAIAVRDGEVLVVGCSQSELADLDEAGPKGDAKGKTQRSVPGPVICTWSRMQRAIAAIDLGSLAVFVRNGEVSVVDSRQPPLAKLDKAIPPSSKIWIANPEGHLGNVVAGPRSRAPLLHLFAQVVYSASSAQAFAKLPFPRYLR
mmetsp:Transcript_48980/g.116516  ORF Transcript_48980/g.116516 Transcript_48980/m.116516 type:complete len:203 (+) Transcript_48980:923-1531(+)